MVADEVKRSISPAKVSQQAFRKSAVADICTLAPWDELAAFRDEMRHKFEEVYGLLHERRDCELRLERQCQQADAKVERFARQTRGLHSRTEIFESHLSGQAKELDACREAHESLRDKVQRSTQEWTANLDTNIQALRSELDEVLEQRHESALEACRRGDRSMADELLKKMGELNEKLGANMLSLEEELVAELRQMRSDLELQDKRLLEGLTDGQASVEQMSGRLDSKIEDIRAEMCEASEGLATTLERSQSDHASRLFELESKLAKVHESFSRLEGRTIAAEQATSNKLEQLKESMDEAVDQNSASLVRVRSELDNATRDMARSVREEMREEMRLTRDESCKEVQSARDEFRSSLASCRELVQSVQQESITGLAELKGDFRTLCRDLYGMVADVQQQTNTAQTDLRSRQDASQQDVDGRLKDLGTKITGLKDEVQDVTRSTSCAHEQLLSLTETLGGAQLRLAELGTSAGKMQGTIDEICSVAAKLGSSVESGLAEVRRELRAEATLSAERQECSWKRQLADLHCDCQQQFDAARTETGERIVILQKDAEDLAHRIGRAERSIDSQVLEMHEHLRERLREQAHDHAKQQTECQAVIEERLQSLVRQNDVSIASVRNDVSKAVSVSRESRSEVERLFQRRIEEVTHSQESRFSEALAACKTACNEKISESVNDFRREMQAVRASIADQAIDSVGRAEQLASEIQKQTNVRGDELKRDLEELEGKFDEQLNSFAATARQNLQETRQETRQHVTRQLEERLRPLSEKITEIVGECKSARRSESDLGHRCDRLQQTCTELGVTQQTLAQQLSSTSQELTELRVEMRGQIQFWRGERATGSRDRSMDRRLLVRDELLHEEPHRSSPTLEASGDEPVKSARCQSQDRWGFSGSLRDFQRLKPRATFDTVLAASPLRSRTPSPTPASGGRLDDTWTFGTRSIAFPKSSDSFSSGRTLLAGPRASPPKSPRSLRTPYV